MATDQDYTELKARCHCGKLSASVEVPTKMLPLPCYVCGCNICQKVSGHLATIGILLPPERKEIIKTGTPVRRATSTGTSGLTRCFCGTCGCFVWEESPDWNRNTLAAGALDRIEGIGQLSDLIFAADSPDGGLKPFLPNLKFYDEFPTDKAGFEPISAERTVHSKNLRFKCHCGGVEYYVTRPGPESWVDRPGNNPSFEPDYEPGDEKTVKWWIRGENSDKYAAEFCLCNSCRQCAGSDLTAWAFIPRPNIIKKDGTPMDFDIGTLKPYRSSPGVTRYFCGTCGAKVFFTYDDRSTVIDNAVGLADAESGARAEEWLGWSHLIGYEEHARNKDLVNHLSAGMEGWKRSGKSAARYKNKT